MHRGPKPGTLLQCRSRPDPMLHTGLLCTHCAAPVVTVSGREGEQGESEGRRVVRYPDAQQLFVGNVPHDVDKTELKEFFERKSLTTTNNTPPPKLIN